MTDWTDIDFKPDADFVKAAAAYDDTPITDDIARGNHVVPTEFAQDLERRLNNMRALCKKLYADWLSVKAQRDEKLVKEALQ